jgi:hypothetical protein
MYDTNTLILIPVENQVRELDPKLLLACIAARRGFSAVIGLRPQVDFRTASFKGLLRLWLWPVTQLAESLVFRFRETAGNLTTMENKIVTQP